MGGGRLRGVRLVRGGSRQRAGGAAARRGAAGSPAGAGSGAGGAAQRRLEGLACGRHHRGAVPGHRRVGARVVLGAGTRGDPVGGGPPLEPAARSSGLRLPVSGVGRSPQHAADHAGPAAAEAIGARSAGRWAGCGSGGVVRLRPLHGLNPSSNSWTRLKPLNPRATPARTPSVASPDAAGGLVVAGQPDASRSPAG